MHADGLAGVVILAGGASSRMGSPKALLSLPHGERLLDYHVRHAQALTQNRVPIMIADNGCGFEADGKLQSVSVHIKDYNADIKSGTEHSTGGALVAILAAMQHINQATGWLLVVSCDSLIHAANVWPRVSALLAIKPATEQDNQVICLSDAQHLYPLLGLYHLSLSAALKAYIDSNQRRVMRFIQPISAHVPIPPEWHGLTNVNTPQDFARAVTIISDETMSTKKTDQSSKTHLEDVPMSPSQLSHLDSSGDISMVDVSEKTATTRQATAVGWVRFPASIYEAIKSADGMTKKGSITQTAHIAGIMAAKRTHDLIPLCHPLPLDKVGLDFKYCDDDCAIMVTALTRVTHKTGVEMEALTAASVACLTIYDMTKALSHDIVIDNIHLVNKTGGKSDYQHK